VDTDEIRNSGSWKRRLTLPAYQYAEVARFARTAQQMVSRAVRVLQPTTLKTGVAPPAQARILSFLDVIEVVVVLDLNRLGFTFDWVRRSHDRLREQTNDAHPFAHATLQSQIGIFLITDSDVTRRTTPNTADDGMIYQWENLLHERFAQFDYQEDIAVRWYPRGRNTAILIDPQIAFGAPIVVGTGVPTRIIQERFNAGEELGQIAEEFGVALGQIEEALDFEMPQASRAA
jgi:uncharacterized protein (DUF433 family)